MSDKRDIKEQIDNDAGLASKRKFLTAVSLIFLVIQLTGAQVTEANTFILKVVFTNQAGLAWFLLMVIGFLLIRYYSYAREYHDQLYQLWSKRMLSENYSFYDQHQMESYGLIADLCPEHLNFERVHDDKHFSWNYRYLSLFPIRRYIVYEWSDENDEYMEKVSLWKKLSLLDYLKILFKELIYRLESIFAYRENLDILGPYLIGTLAICSYFFNEEVMQLVRLVFAT